MAGVDLVVSGQIVELEQRAHQRLHVPAGQIRSAAGVPEQGVAGEQGVRTPVVIRFTTPWRTLKMVALGLAVVFLPVIIAFLLNGFSVQGLHPEGAAVWLCIFVVVVPAYYIKMGRIDIYENPYVYALGPDGSRRKLKTRSRTVTVRDVLKALFSPPLIVAALALLLFLVMGVYLTLGN